MASSEWCEFEDKLLMNLYPDTPFPVLQCFFSFRSRAAIACRASRLQISRKNNWTKEQDRVILNCYKERGAKYCQRYLPEKTLDAIRHRARRLNVMHEPKLAKNKDNEVDKMKLADLQRELLTKDWSRVNV